MWNHVSKLLQTEDRRSHWPFFRFWAIWQPGISLGNAQQTGPFPQKIIQVPIEMDYVLQANSWICDPMKVPVYSLHHVATITTDIYKPASHLFDKSGFQNEQRDYCGETQYSRLQHLSQICKMELKSLCSEAMLAQMNREGSL